MKPPIALTIAGSDSGGGAGIQADLKTFSALGVYGASVITALTAQNTKGVTAVMDASEELVAAQLDAVFDDIAIDAVKIGMLSSSTIIETVAAALRRYEPAHVVLDPVMVATSGDALLQPDAVEALRDVLLPLASIITPNLPEAAALLGRKDHIEVIDLKTVAQDLLALGPGAVLVKGGHLDGEGSPDLLLDGNGATTFAARRIDSVNTHGTGCTLSSAIAAHLARGLTLRDAVGAAKTYITGTIAAGRDFEIGGGQGPVHHFHKLWKHLEERP